jgi:hypothetical protein
MRCDGRPACDLHPGARCGVLNAKRHNAMLSPSRGADRAGEPPTGCGRCARSHRRGGLVAVESQAHQGALWMSLRSAALRGHEVVGLVLSGTENPIRPRTGRLIVDSCPAATRPDSPQRSSASSPATRCHVVTSDHTASTACRRRRGAPTARSRVHRCSRSRHQDRDALGSVQAPDKEPNHRGQAVRLGGGVHTSPASSSRWPDPARRCCPADPRSP